jgi:methyl-accepting chemotaxis protein
MQAIVRKAQRNFQFAMIYEQRKTNEILVEGFTDLAEALAGMTSQITTSINELASSVGELTSTFNESMGEIYSRMDITTETTNQQHREIMDEAYGQAERQEEVVEMLDNIQRGRKP